MSKATLEQLRAALRELTVRPATDGKIKGYYSPIGMLQDAIEELAELREREPGLKKREEEHDAARVALDRLFAGVDGGLPIPDAVRAAVGDTMIERAIAVLVGDPHDRSFLVLSKACSEDGQRMILQIEPQAVQADRNLMRIELEAFVYSKNQPTPPKRTNALGALLMNAARRGVFRRTIPDDEHVDQQPTRQIRAPICESESTAGPWRLVPEGTAPTQRYLTGAQPCSSCNPRGEDARSPDPDPCPTCSGLGWVPPPGGHESLRPPRSPSGSPAVISTVHVLREGRGLCGWAPGGAGRWIGITRAYETTAEITCAPCLLAVENLRNAAALARTEARRCIHNLDPEACGYCNGGG